MAKENQQVKCLKIERETYESKKKDIHISLEVCKEIKASLIPSDIGGYNLVK